MRVTIVRLRIISLRFGYRTPILLLDPILELWGYSCCAMYSFTEVELFCLLLAAVQAIPGTLFLLQGVLAPTTRLCVTAIINTESNIEITVEGGVDGTSITFLGQTRTYTCRTYVGAPSWVLIGLDTEDLVVTPGVSSFDFNGFTTPRLTAVNQPSVLTVVASGSNNNTEIQCAQSLSGLDFGNTSEYFVLLVLGKPIPKHEDSSNYKSIQGPLLPPQTLWLHQKV